MINRSVTPAKERHPGLDPGPESSGFSENKVAGFRVKPGMTNKVPLRSADSINSKLLDHYFAAVIMISTMYCGDANLLSTQARAGGLAGSIQASQISLTALK